MPVSYDNKLNNEVIKKNFKVFINGFQNSLNLTDNEMAEKLQLSDLSFQEYLLGKMELPLLSVYEILDEYNICFEAILHNSVDYRALAQQADGNLNYLPERYQQSANSNRRSAIYMLDYINSKYGYHQRLSLMRKMQLNENHFVNPDALNNIFLPLDICKSLFENGSKEDIIGMGMHFYDYSKESIVAGLIKEARSAPEAYEIMFSGVLEKYVERNFCWRIKSISSETCVLSGKLNSELEEIGSQIINQHMCLLRLGFASSITRFINQPNARVKKISCLAKSDKSCDYHVSFATKNSYNQFQ